MVARIHDRDLPDHARIADGRVGRRLVGGGQTVRKLIDERESTPLLAATPARADDMTTMVGAGRAADRSVRRALGRAKRLRAVESVGRLGRNSHVGSRQLAVVCPAEHEVGAALGYGD
jgi:hypothetical protein